MGAVIGVVGGSGGVGASSFAAVLAAVAGGALVDLDVSGGGIDVTLGIESVPGARWSDVRVAGGPLQAETLAGALPRWGPVPVLAADVARLEAAAVAQLLDVLQASWPVILDLPRADCPARVAALPLCAVVVVIARADVDGLVAAHAMVDSLAGVPSGLVCRRGEVPVADAARLVGAPLLGELPPVGLKRLVLNSHRPPAAAARVAGGVLHGVGVGGVRHRHAA